MHLLLGGLGWPGWVHWWPQVQGGLQRLQIDPQFQWSPSVAAMHVLRITNVNFVTAGDFWDEQHNFVTAGDDAFRRDQMLETARISLRQKADVLNWLLVNTIMKHVCHFI